MNSGKFRRIGSTMPVSYSVQVTLRNGRYLQKRGFQHLINTQAISKCVLNPKTFRELSKISENHDTMIPSTSLDIEAVPNFLKFLFLDEENGKSITTYPSITTISNLVRDMDSSNVNVDVFEDKFQSDFKLSFDHNSRKYSSKSEQLNYFKQLMEHYINLEMKDAPHDASHILQYVLVTWRLGEAIQRILQDPNQYQEEISTFERLMKQTASESNRHTMLYFYWTNLLAEGTLYCTRKASRVAKRHPEIVNYFLNDVREYINDIHNNQINHNRLPKCFDVRNLLLHGQHRFLEGSLDSNIDTIILDSSVALIYWYEDMPDRTFSLLSKCFDLLSNRDTQKCIDLLSNRDTQKLSESHIEDVIICFSEVVQDTVEENNESWHNRVHKLLHKLDIPYPIFHYIYYIYLDASSQACDKSRKNELLQENPKISFLEKFRLNYKVLSGTDGKMRRESISNFLEDLSRSSYEESASIIDELKNNINESEPMSESSIEACGLSSPDNDVDSHSNVESEFEQFLETSNHKSAIDMLAENIFPSQDLLDRLFKDVVNTRDKKLINNLRTVLPVKSEMSDNLYVEENRLWMSEVRTLWKLDNRLDALYKSLSRYETLLEEEYSLQLKTFKSVKQAIHSVIRKYSWSLLEDRTLEVGHISNLDELKSSGHKLGDMYQDYSILAMYLETLYFSKDIQLRMKAEEVISQYPYLPRCLNMDAVIDIAVNDRNDKLFFIILQFCLRFDFDDHVKSKVIEKWIIYQCEKGNEEGLRKANELIVKAKQLKIPVTPDALQYSLLLKNNLSGLTDLTSRIMRVLRLKS